MKRIISLNESDLSRIVRRVINERSLITEGVPDTILKANSQITIPARQICKNTDYIKGSVILQNVGTYDAYLIQKPVLNITSVFPNEDPNIRIVLRIVSFNTTIKNQPIYGNPEGDIQSKIPKGTSATLNFVIEVDFRYSTIHRKIQDALTQQGSVKDKNSAKYRDYENFINSLFQEINKLRAAISKLTASFTVKYNGQDLSIPITFEGLSIETKRSCDAKISLPTTPTQTGSKY